MAFRNNWRPLSGLNLLVSLAHTCRLGIFISSPPPPPHRQINKSTRVARITHPDVWIWSGCRGKWRSTWHLPGSNHAAAQFIYPLQKLPKTETRPRAGGGIDGSSTNFPRDPSGASVIFPFCYFPPPPPLAGATTCQIQQCAGDSTSLPVDKSISSAGSGIGGKCQSVGLEGRTKKKSMKTFLTRRSIIVSFNLSPHKLTVCHFFYIFFRRAEGNLQLLSIA